MSDTEFELDFDPADPLAQGPSAQELEFCRLYIRYNQNGTRAAGEAFPGLTTTQAASKAHRLLNKPQVFAVIYHAMQEAVKRVQVDADFVLREAVEVYGRCMQKEKILDRDGIFTGEFKFDATNSLKALDLIGRHISVSAFEQRGEDNKDTVIRERLARARLRRPAAQQETLAAISRVLDEESPDGGDGLPDTGGGAFPNFMEPPQIEVEAVEQEELPARARELIERMRAEPTVIDGE